MSNQPLTIGLDLGDRSSFYCVLNEAGGVILEERVTTSPKAMRKIFEKMPRSRIALEIGTHSPWVSRLLTELGHEAIVAHAPNVRIPSGNCMVDGVGQPRVGYFARFAA